MNALTLPFRPYGRSEMYRSLLFLLMAVPVGAATLGLLIAGWVATGVLLVTPLVVVALLAFRGAIGLLAAGDAALARELLGTTAYPRLRSGGSGFWRRGLAIAKDTSFWLQQAYLALRMTLGFGLAVAEFSLLAASFGSLADPITYRWSDLHLGAWQIDTFARSLVLVPVGLVGLSVAGWLAVGLGRMWARIVDTMLASDSAR
ncbi:MAG TPA: sensor domain-containing protein, partial [Gaiellales bacterium]